jgi:hypothetical protein
VTAARTAGVCLVLAGIALAEPTFRIGTKLTSHMGGGWSSSGDTTVREVYDKPSVGAAVEASYGPAWGFLTGRIDLAQVDIFTSGGAAFRLFPMLGLDLMAEPPTQWRVKPYVWVGVRTTAYTQPAFSGVYEFYHDSETHWRGGLGVKYALTNRIDLFAEMQTYERDEHWDGAQTLPDGAWIVGWSTVEGIGLVNAGIGARFALGK